MFGKFKAKPSSPQLPSAQVEPERYAGRPIFVLIENFVLYSIGHLPSDQAERVGEVVQRVFGGTDSWTDTLKRVLDLEPSIEETFRSLWERNKVIASQAGVELHPVQFAKMIVDSNFAGINDSELTDGNQS